MSEKTTWIGGCLCGTCRYEFRGDPLHTGYCHCDMCKKGTGGPFAVLVQASLEAFGWTKGRPGHIALPRLRRAAFAICVEHLLPPVRRWRVDTCDSRLGPARGILRRRKQIGLGRWRTGLAWRENARNLL